MCSNVHFVRGFPSCPCLITWGLPSYSIYYIYNIFFWLSHDYHIIYCHIPILYSIPNPQKMVPNFPCLSHRQEGARLTYHTVAPFLTKIHEEILRLKPTAILCASQGGAYLAFRMRRLGPSWRKCGEFIYVYMFYIYIYIYILYIYIIIIYDHVLHWLTRMEIHEQWCWFLILGLSIPKWFGGQSFWAVSGWKKWPIMV